MPLNTSPTRHIYRCSHTTERVRVIDSLNRHVALEDFEPTDLADFTVKAAAF